MTDDSKTATNRRARDERKQAHLRAMMDRYTERFRAAVEPGAREIHAAMDEVLERDRRIGAESGGIRCGKGCDHCCRGPVEIWPREAALLVEAARAAGVELDTVRLERQSRYAMDAWRQQPRAERACVFLGEDGACKVYESRPNACRKLLVVSDPALCDAAKHPPERVDRWYSWEAEVMESAALEVFGGTLMPGALLAALENERRK
jgi:hypothetical protein